MKDSVFCQAVKVVKLDKCLHGNVKAFVTISLNGLTIRGCKVIQQANQRAWFALPQVESGGKYYPVVEAEPELKEAISQAVLKAWGVAL